jgi:hypothetical protein
MTLNPVNGVQMAQARVKKAASLGNHQVAAAKAGATSAAYPQTIFEVGADGGSLSIRRTKRADGEWQFAVFRNEETLWNLLHEQDREGLTFSEESADMDSFAAALKLLDHYAWHGLYPITLHADYAEIVMAEVARRDGDRGVRRWNSVLSLGAREK